MGKKEKDEVIPINDVFIISDLNDNKVKSDSIRFVLNEVYEDIMEILKDYSDLKEKDYQIIALWIIGTYFFREFITYPFLFLNAMKGSGKSRTLRLICSLSWNGKIIGSPTEAVLFRTAGNGTLGIDEFEGIMKKENAGLREILNSAYKKGMKIVRMRKKKTIDGETQIPEEFEPYTPIVMANIYGMEEVLGDRCITTIIDKSSNSFFTMKVEDFDNDFRIKDIKNRLKSLENVKLVTLCRYFDDVGVYISWNSYVNRRFKYNVSNVTNDTNDTNDTNNDLNFNINDIKKESFFNKIVDSGLNGRDLELFLPLFLIGMALNDEILEKILKISSETSKDKKKDEMMESRDVLLIQFISEQLPVQFYKLTELTEHFKHFIEYSISDEAYNWLNPKWMGRALKRLDLIIDKRKMANGREFILNIPKAIEKLRSFNNGS